MADWKPVKLAAKVIGHISQGMYRTPAGAVKELISNAYDAGASYAKIHTSFPRFDFFSCEDDGCGISQNKFVDLMSGGIGDSDKQGLRSQPGKKGRPIIGRLGVGLLSLAQICPKFTISSFDSEQKAAFEAEIKFPPYSRKEIDKIVAEGTKLLTHGEYRITEIPYDPKKRGITVATASLRDSFRKKMSDLKNFAHTMFYQSSESYPDFDTFLKVIANPELSSFYFASQYDQFLFGLALAAPIPYVERSDDTHKEGLETVITRIPEIATIQAALKSYDFRVEVDNIELRRPVVLPSNGNRALASDCIVPKTPKKSEFKLVDGAHQEIVAVEKYEIGVTKRPETFQLYWFEYSKKVNSYPLEFCGYIFVQTSRLFPKEYQGILIRLRNVAIGQYDVNIMTYPQAEGPRFSMISAEVFVKEGLDDALKVDRDGFNTLDPQYIRLQAFVHSILHELIFPGSWGEEKARNKQLRQKKEKQVESKFSKALSRVTNKTITKLQIVPKTESRASNVAVEIDRPSKTVKIYEANPEAREILGLKKHRGIAARIIAAFEAANIENSAERRRQIFYKLIGEIFNE